MRALVYNWDLISNLVQRDIKLHYQRSFFGILWSQINPLISVIIFTIVFQKIVPLNIPNYPAYVFSGLLAWNWFSNSLNQANFSLTSSRDLVRKPNFATEMIVVVSVSSNLVNYLLSMPVLFGLLIINNVPFTLTLFFLPVVIAIEFFFTLGLALIISAANVFFRDVMHITAVVTGIWFYITPVFYRTAGTPNDFEFLYSLNPMNHLIQAYRQVLLYGQLPDLTTLAGLAAMALLTFGIGLFFFQRLKYDFVDAL
ncbi:MAG TPA: ABC transporter permease [Chloroflexia bacterium]|nr:ABC transporter permease [Chloroflexia bacterium]